MQAMTVFCYNNEFRAVNRLGYCYGLLLYHRVYSICGVTRFFGFHTITGDSWGDESTHQQGWNVCM